MVERDNMILLCKSKGWFKSIEWFDAISLRVTFPRLVLRGVLKQNKIIKIQIRCVDWVVKKMIERTIE